MCYNVLVQFFVRCQSFSPSGGCQHFSFSYRRYKIFMLFLRRYWSPLFFISRSSSFSVIHVNVDIKMNLKERIGLVVLFFSSKSPGGYQPANSRRISGRSSSPFAGQVAMRFYHRNARVLEMQNFTYSVRTILLKPKFLGCTGCNPFNQNSDRSDREKWTTSKGGPVLSKLFRLN